MNEQQKEELRHLVQSGMTIADAARQLKADVRKAQNYIATLRQRGKFDYPEKRSSPNFQGKPLGKRCCLFCRKPFTYFSKGEFVCFSCKRTDAWQNGFIEI